MNNVIENKKIRQSNEFVSAPYANELTLHEIKIIEYLIADCKEIDLENLMENKGKRFSFSATSLATILNTSLSRIVTDGDKLANDITQKRIIERNYNKNGELAEFTYISLVTYANYKSGTFTFTLNCDVLKYFININKNFTEFQLKHLLSMRSAYAIKLYKILYQYRKIGKRTFLVDELKLQFGIKDKYSQYGDFKKIVIIPAVYQINALTDLIVIYEEEKIGRKVDKLEFKFKINKDKVFDDSLLLSDKIIDIEAISVNDDRELNRVDTIIANISNKISISTKKIIRSIYTTRGEDYLIASIEYAKENAKTNFDKYLKDTLENDWALSKLNKIQEKKAVEVKNQILAETELEEKNKRKEQRKIQQDEIKANFLNLSIEERASIFSELVSQISKASPEKMAEVIASQEDYTISFWAIRNNINYSGALQLNLKSWLKLNY